MADAASFWVIFALTRAASNEIWNIFFTSLYFEFLSVVKVRALSPEDIFIVSQLKVEVNT